MKADLNTFGRSRLARVWIVFAAVAALAIAASCPAIAKTAMLSERTVKQFIASYPDVKTIAVGQAVKQGTDIAGSSDILAAVIQAAADDTIQRRIDTTVRQHGFSGSKEWMAVAESVGRAYAHIKAGPTDGKAQKKVDKAIAKIEKNDFLSDKHKEKLIKALRDSSGKVLEAPPPENLAAVKPMLAQIDAVVK